MSILRFLIPIVLASLTSGAFGQDLLKSQPPLWSTKPDIAAFEKSENDRLTVAQFSIEAIVAVKDEHTIENTLAPYDDAVREIDDANNIAKLQQQVHPDAAFRDHATAIVAKASAAKTALSLNRNVYEALARIDMSHADQPSRYYVKRTLLEFRLGGVSKDAATRTRLKQLNDELTKEQSAFERNISDDQRSVEVGDASELAGLPEDYIKRHKPGADGKIRITTANPDLPHP